jgi:hypothetical protein
MVKNMQEFQENKNLVNLPEEPSKKAPYHKDFQHI